MLKWLFLMTVLLFAGCVTNSQTVISRDCNALQDNLREQCFFEKSLYYSLLGNYTQAIQSCEELKPSGLGGRTIDFLLTGSKANIYNKCITNVALYAKDDRICHETIETNAATLLFGLTTTDSYDLCKEKLASLEYQESQLPRLLNDIFSP